MTKTSILVTGGAGFIGSNFIINFLKKYQNYHVINLDLLTYAADLKNLEDVEDSENYTFIKGDICDRELVEKIFKDYSIRGVIHFAAESHVDNSITGPGAFIRTNVNGTFTVLDVARAAWMDEPFKFKPGFEDCRFHHISTDEVYGTLGETGYFTEETPYAPNSPYSASKASADMIVRSYFHTYGMNVVTTNCSNNYGPRQHNEKLIPTIIRKALAEEPIPIYGDGKNIRDWLHVEDHCLAIDLVYHKGKSGESYIIGGETEKTNLEILILICDLLDLIKPRPSKNKYIKLISYVKDRAGHDKRYAVASKKIKENLHWKSTKNIKNGIKEIITSIIEK